jgi:hypothetical protein
VRYHKMEPGERYGKFVYLTPVRRELFVGKDVQFVPIHRLGLRQSTREDAIDLSHVFHASVKSIPKHLHDFILDDGHHDIKRVGVHEKGVQNRSIFRLNTS